MKYMPLTGSEIVLAWLNGDCSKWKTFVANRISTIKESILNGVWNHVTSKDNPADNASRGIYPREMVNNIIWWKGPSLLQLEEYKTFASKFTTETE